MNIRIGIWLMRIARRPPSRKQIILMATVLAAAFTLFGYERIFGWPEAMQIGEGFDRRGGVRIRATPLE